MAVLSRGLIKISSGPDLRRRRTKKATAATMAREPRTVPTAMPAFAPPERPSEPPETATGLAVVVAAGGSKSSEVTLKQGTWMLKSLASTKVW